MLSALFLFLFYKCVSLFAYKLLVILNKYFSFQWPSLVNFILAYGDFFSVLGDIFSYKILPSFFFYFVVLLFSSLLTTYLGVYGVYYSCGFALFIFWASLVFYSPDFLLNQTVSYFTSSKSLIFSESIIMNFSLVIDRLNFSFLLLIASIGLCASLYTLSYFKNEPHADRFVLLIHWFIVSMSLLVSADNVFIMFLGWELIGLTSFLLINFWTLRRGTLKSAIKAFSFNKISDIFILLFIVLMVQQTQSCLFSTWLTIFDSGLLNGESLWWAIFFLILGSSIKSAQIIGHLWLPDSMEAPIPASALIHSATLVSAGVYLLSKFNNLLLATDLHLFTLTLGSLTAFYGVVVSSSQTDLKRLLAYSTISHCGFLFVTVSLGDLHLTTVYLYLHGFFKALTFFCVGNFVKYSRGYQDSRMMGSYAQIFPVESILFLICAFNLGGLPFVVGFSYKHLVKIFISTSLFYTFIISLLSITMLLGLVYVYRLVYYVLLDIKKGSEAHYTGGFQNQANNYPLTMNSLNSSEHATNNSSISISTPISLLGISALLLVSFLSYYLYLGWPASYYGNSLLPVDSAIFSHSTSSFPSYFVLFFFSISFTLTLFLFVTETRQEFSSNYRKHFLVIVFFVIPLFFILFL